MGGGELLFNGYRVSVWNNGKWLHNNVEVLKIVTFYYFTTIFKKCKQDDNTTALSGAT